jgi:hypothetical protein
MILASSSSSGYFSLFLHNLLLISSPFFLPSWQPNGQDYENKKKDDYERRKGRERERKSLKYSKVFTPRSSSITTIFC